MRPSLRALRATLLVLVVAATACRPVAPPSGPVASPAAGAPAVRLYVEPEAGTQPVVQFISAARRTLDVAMYLLSDREIQTALEAAPRRGVKVRVMLEEHPYGTGPGNDQVASRLKNADIAVTWSPATFQLSHDKYAVADGATALVGTANWTHSAFVDNREYVLVDSDPADVGQLAKLFDSDWSRQAANLDDPNLVVSPTSARPDLQGLIGSARQSLQLEAEELQDPAIEDALIAAAKRGVEVRMVLPLATEGPDANAAGRARVGAAGVKVRRLRAPYVHAKDLVVDGKEAFVGSENLSTPSLDQNREVGLLVADPGSIQTLGNTFEKDWAQGKP